MSSRGVDTGTSALDVLAEGRIVERYRLEQELGRGGMAVVWRVRHVELGSVHALKVLTLGVPSVQQRLLLEGRVQASLRHRNTVSVTDVVRVDGMPALVLEFVHGPPLDVLQYYYAPNLAQVDDLAIGILRGVQAAHDLGLIHRDLKPANVLCEVEAETVVPKVADFGLAKVLEDSVHEPNLATRSGVTMGTPTFMAPEQYRDAKKVDQRADVFSLGAVLYQLVTGKPAFEGTDMIAVYESQMNRAYRPVREMRPDAPERWVRAIEAALEPQVQTRVASASALLTLWRGEDRGVYAPLAPGPVWDVHALDAVRKLVPEIPRVATGASPPSPATWALPPDPASPSLIPPSSAPGDDDVVPRRRGRWLAALAVVGGVCVLGAAGILVAVGVATWIGSGPSAAVPGPDELAKSEVHGVVEAPAPEATAGPEPAAVIAPEPVAPVSASPTRPVRVVSPPARSSTAPSPPAADGPAPAPVRPATPEVPATTVEVVGALRAYLQDALGRRHVAGGPIPPGTYDLWVVFEEGRATRVRSGVVVEQGRTLHVSCQAGIRSCGPPR